MQKSDDWLWKNFWKISALNVAFSSAATIIYMHCVEPQHHDSEQPVPQVRSLPSLPGQTPG